MIIPKQQFIKQLFIYFQKQNNAYERYMLNFNNRSKMSKYYPKKAFKKYFISCYHKDIIYNAFAWKNTPQGNIYWATLSYNWEKLLKTIGLNYQK